MVGFVDVPVVETVDDRTDCVMTPEPSELQPTSSRDTESVATTSLPARAEWMPNSTHPLSVDLLVTMKLTPRSSAPRIRRSWWAPNHATRNIPEHSRPIAPFQ